MRLIGLLVVSLTLLGCTPRFYDYYVIVIPLEAGAQVRDSGEANNDMVYFGDAIVTAYHLDRQAYSLLAKLDFRTSHPTVDFAAHDPAGVALEIAPLRVGPCGSFKTFGLQPELDSYPAVRYQWRPRWNKDCAIDDRGPYPPDQVVRFEVRTPGGQLLAVEEIPFELRRNGTYLEFDAL